MRLRQRTSVIIAVDLVVFLVVANLAFSGQWPFGLFIAILFVTHVVGGNLAHRFWVRCPHCDKWAGRTPSGWYTIWPSTHCRYCRSKY
jgi:hypothetical protein